MSIEARELLEADVAEAQKRRGKLPTSADNARYMADVLRRLDRKKSENALAPVSGVSKKPGAREAEAKKRAARAGFELLPGSWSIDRPKPLAVAPGGAFQIVKNMPEWERRMRARLRLLRSKPDWADKLKRINPLALQGALGPEKKREATNAVIAVIDASNATFGHWMKTKAPPIYSYKGQGKRG